MKNWLPFIDLITNYQKKDLKGDFSAGFTTGMLLIPQGMAYAVLAGLPVEYGLYASLLIPIIYMLFGTSTRLVVGPAALDSILLASGMTAFTIISNEDYIEKVMLIVFMAGIFQMLAGFLKLGFIANLFSQPLLKSFITAAAILILFSQLKYIFQIQIVRSSLFHEVVIDIAHKITDINWKSLSIGIFSFLFIRILGKLNLKKIATPLILVIGIVISYLFNFAAHDIAVVGFIPDGLPEFTMINFGSLNIIDALPLALLIGLMGFTLSSSISKSVEDEPEKVRPNQEFIALGLSNIIGSFFGAYQADSSFSRTTINKSAGANTRLSNLISSLIILLVLLFFTSYFFYLPKAILGAVIIAAIPSLMDFKYFKKTYDTSKIEFYIMLVTFVTTLEFGIIFGLSIGVSLSMIAFLRTSIKPHIAQLGKLKDSKVYRNINRFKNAEEQEHQVIFRVDSPLYFTNIRTVLDQIDLNCKSKTIKQIVLDGSSIYHIDITAIEVIESWINKKQQAGTIVYFTSITGPTRDAFFKSNIINIIGGQQLFLDINSCQNFIQDSIEPDSFGIANQNN